MKKERTYYYRGKVSTHVGLYRVVVLTGSVDDAQKDIRTAAMAEFRIPQGVMSGLFRVHDVERVTKREVGGMNEIKACRNGDGVWGWIDQRRLK